MKICVDTCLGSPQMHGTSQQLFPQFRLASGLTRGEAIAIRLEAIALTLTAPMRILHLSVS